MPRHYVIARLIDVSNSFMVYCSMIIWNAPMNLRFLRTFVVIADTKGFARAAARLNLTQSAASRQIQALEKELGVRLFDRINRRIKLTSEGEDLLVRSRRLLSDAESLGERARALKSGQTGVLRIGAAPQIIENLLADFLQQYRKRHAGIEVHLVEDQGGHLPARLEAGDMHVALLPDSDERFFRRPLFPMFMIAVMAKDHRLGRRVTLDIKDLIDEPLLRLGPGFASYAWFEAACRIERIQPRVLLESITPHTLMALARTGLGIALINSVVRVPRDKVSATVVLQNKLPIGRWTVAAWDRQRFLPPYAAQFVDELVRSCRRDYPGRELVRSAPALPRPSEK
jgi:LysR family transcriptional regulator, cyn operon transcriptional activator